MKKLITTIFIFLSLTSFSQVGGNKYTIVVKGDSTGGSSIDSAELAAKLILKANQSALIDSATALRSGINTKQPLLGFTPYNVTNPAGYLTSVPAQSYASLTGKPDLTVYTLKADSIDGSKILKQTIPTLSFTAISPIQVLNDSTATVSKQVFDSLTRKAALTGFSSATGTVTSADSVISAFQKLNGNIEQVKRRTVASIITATDANISAVAGTLYNLPAATLSTSRSINISALNQSGDYLEINNEENGYAWTITGATLYLGDGVTTVTQLVTNATTQIRFNGIKIKIIN